MKTIEPQSWKADLPEFRQKTKQFYDGQLDKGSYKGFSGRYGSYAQRGGQASMLRLRMTAGRMTKEKLQFIADVIDQYHVNLVHLTTCQTVQLHNLDQKAVCEIMEKALDHGIVTMGGGGDFPRNVMMSSLSGVEEEYFDVLPWAEAAGEHLMNYINAEKMPRKLKVGFSNSPANVTHATFRDLGFVARPDGKFDVYSAGGLGANPRFGVKVGEGVEPEKILYYIQAMWETFRAYGNYENRGKARTRYMQEKLGAEGYEKAFKEKLCQVMNSGMDLNFVPQKTEITKRGDGSTAEGMWIQPQKQEGLYSFHYHPIGGAMKPEKFRELYETIKEMDQVEIRLSPDESLYVINLTGKEAEKVSQVLKDGAKTRFETSVACIGASICQVGVRDSQKLLASCVKAVREAGIPDAALPQIHISGCPSSCGTHQIGALGFRGGVKMVDKKPLPAFVLYLNGCDRQGGERMGRELGTILEEDVPLFLTELGKTVGNTGMEFGQWMETHEEEIEKIAEKYLQ